MNEATRPATGPATGVDQVVAELNEIIVADGGRLVVRKSTATALELELDLEHSSCPDCVVHKDMLIDIVTARLQVLAPDVCEIHLHDPREAGAEA